MAAVSIFQHLKRNRHGLGRVLRTSPQPSRASLRGCWSLRHRCTLHFRPDGSQCTAQSAADFLWSTSTVCFRPSCNDTSAAEIESVPSPFRSIRIASRTDPSSASVRSSSGLARIVGELVDGLRQIENRRFFTARQIIGLTGHPVSCGSASSRGQYHEQK